MNNQLRIHETKTLVTKDTFTGVEEVPFYVVSGARMIVTLAVISATGGTTVSLDVENTFNMDIGYEVHTNLTRTTAGRTKKTLTDFHNLFNLKVTVSGGTASFRIGVSLVDNALDAGDVSIGSVTIEDSDGDELNVNNDGSIKTVQLFNLPYDTITATYPSSTQEVYASRVGGVSGTIQQTITINYTDSTKNSITNVVRT